jgi:hypothetical protein
LDVYNLLIEKDNTIVVPKAMTKMSEAKPTTITAITHSPTPPVTTLCFSPDTTGCLKTGNEKKRNIYENRLNVLIDFVPGPSCYTDKVGRFGIDGVVAKFEILSFFVQGHVEIVANFSRVQNGGAVEIQVIVDQDTAATTLTIK